MLARYEHEPGVKDVHLEIQRDKETREKYDNLERIFWVRKSDLLDIVPRYGHLSGIHLDSAAMAFPPSAPSKPAFIDKSAWWSRSRRDGPAVAGSGNLMNGYH